MRQSGTRSTQPTVTASDVVFLLDVDNTLLDNDRITSDLRMYLVQTFGEARAVRYWEVFEALRSELGYADYLGALQRYRTAVAQGAAHEHQLLQMSSFLIDYPFADRLYPGALDAVRALSAIGKTVILSDGDVVFQPRKITRSGLWDAVAGRVLIYVHKEQSLDMVQALFPARHYVMVDDKLRLLTAMKAVLRERLTTVFVQQGHYAQDVIANAEYPLADVVVQSIDSLTAWDRESWQHTIGHGSATSSR